MKRRRVSSEAAAAAVSAVTRVAATAVAKYEGKTDLGVLRSAFLTRSLDPAYIGKQRVN